jgi:hypothetical protein
MAAYPLSSAPALLAPAGAVEIHNQTDVRLDQNNFVVVKTNAAGKCKGFAFLGIITMKPAKFSKALDRCYAQAAIEYGKPQTLVNVVMERNTSYWILFSLPEVSVRGDVVEFMPAEPYDDESMEPVEVGRKRKSRPAPSSEVTLPAGPRQRL